ncbi:unnamed protein product [Cladocopium goreaui]|uniref:Uncharacterized protein n=1 Tax=Cladocopium goreaui TaxID=2562237 RepID=A0A9P1D454_9DINO|nr:unnamed protein product [Cladocopium goreaui]
MLLKILLGSLCASSIAHPLCDLVSRHFQPFLRAPFQLTCRQTQTQELEALTKKAGHAADNALDYAYNAEIDTTRANEKADLAEIEMENAESWEDYELSLLALLSLVMVGTTGWLYTQYQRWISIKKAKDFMLDISTIFPVFFVRRLFYPDFPASSNKKNKHFAIHLYTQLPLFSAGSILCTQCISMPPCQSMESSPQAAVNIA